MRIPLVLATVAAAALATLSACSSDSGLPPAPGPTFSAQMGGEGTLVVDDDGADCPHAKFNSIQAAVLAAQPGDRILVCRGVYPENVLVDKADLRIEAQGAPGDVVLQGSAAQPFGFHLRNTTGVLVQGFTVQQFGIANLIIQGGRRNTLRKNVTTASVLGIEVTNSADNIVEQNTASFNTRDPLLSDGIFVRDSRSTGNIIRHNETAQNTNGIGLFNAGRGNVIFGNRSYANNRFGIRNVALSHGTVIDNNHVFANAQGGVFIGNSTDVTARNNRSERNTAFGFLLQNGATTNVVEKNEILDNTQDGIQLQNNVGANIIQLNHIRQSGRDGIRVDATSGGNTFERNVIRESGDHDAHDDSVGPGTAGTANVWLRNHCATQNRPGLCEHLVNTPA